MRYWTTFLSLVALTLVGACGQATGIDPAPQPDATGQIDADAPSNAQAPPDADQPSDAQAPPDADQTSDTQAPPDADEPSDAQAPSDADEPSDAQAPSDADQPSDAADPSDADEPSDTHAQVDPAVPADTAAPTWPTDAALMVTDVLGDRLTISWPLASDAYAVTGYRLFVNGLLHAEVSGGTTSAIVEPLKSATDYVFDVRARDAAGNLSVALTITAGTADITSPTWPSGATLIADEIGETNASLSWTAANDDLGVSAYQVLHGQEVIATVEGVTVASVEGLMPWTEYTLAVVAEDAAGNASELGPEGVFSTTDETAPSWVVDAALEITALTPESVGLAWPAASDNVAVDAYDLLVDKVVVATTDGDTTWATVDGLTPGAALTFTVQAVDPAGNVSATGPVVTVNTTDEGAPEWPDGAALLVSALQPNTLTLAWPEASDDVGVVLYRVTQDGEVIATVSTTHIDIAELSPWTDYSFSVTAEDAAQNASPISLTVSTKTPDHSPPSWAESDTLTVSELTAENLTLSWPAASDDVEVAGYRIYQDNQLVAELNAQATLWAATGLAPWTDYAYRVTAVDLAGNTSSGDLSVEVQTPDESAPTWPGGSLSASDVTPTTLTLTWTAAQDDVAVTHYRVLLNDAELDLVDGDTTSLPVVELAPWTDYVFRVEAVDVGGNWSQSSPSASLKTPDWVNPTWPVDGALTLSELQATSAVLSWPAADDDVGVERYVISVDDVEVATIDGGLLSATVPQLNPVTTYLFTVWAVDPAGNTSTSLTLTETTPDGGPPTWPGGSLSVVEVNNDSVVLSWTSAVDDVEVTGYRLYQDDSPVGDFTLTQAEVNNLESGTSYAFRVEAGDAAGNWSATGPSAQVATTEVYDPGFRRLTSEQFQRALADVSSTLWREGCQKFKTAKGWEGDGCPLYFEAYEESSHVYNKLTEKEYGEFLQYRDTFPRDARKGAPEDVYGGHWRLDQSVFSEHVTSWTLAVMTLASDWFREREYGSHMRGFNLVAETCHIDHTNGVTNFSTWEEVYQHCAYDFIQRLGRRAFRRPLTEEETAFFNSIYDDTAANYPDLNLGSWLGRPLLGTALRNIMAAILLSPEFLYHIEVGDEDGNLTPYELASRLSFHFWNTTPDDELLAAAEDGSLMTEEGYQTQIDRLFDDPRGQRAVEEFYSAYFRVDDIDDIDAQDGPYLSSLYHSGPNYEEGTHPDDAVVAGGYNKQNNTAPMYMRAAKAELLNLGEWFTRAEPGTYEEMFRSNLHFLECQQGSLPGQCYGAAAYSLFSYRIPGTCLDMQDCADQSFIDTGHGWDGVSEPITLPEPERAGLITRISFLGNDTLNARPVQRGLKIRDMLLCEPIPPPEDCDVVKPPNLTGHCELDGVTTGQSCSHDMHCGQGEVCVDWDKEVRMTVRETVEELTETPGTSCAGCHTTFINGFGHALNHFSSAGQYWEKEHMFSDVRHPNKGNFLFETLPADQWLPIDASATFFFDGAQVSVDGAHQAADLLVESGKLEQCWSREYFRFTMGRVEHTSDMETIEDFAQSLRDGASLAETFTSVAHLPQFKTLSKIPIGQAEEEETP